MWLNSLLALTAAGASAVQAYTSPPVSIRVDAGFEEAPLVTQYLCVRQSCFQTSLINFRTQ
jgi:hypothetical protein